MRRSHFFDIDVLLVVDNMVWLVDKTNPNIPIFKISKYDFNLIKSGIYKSQNNKIDFNGSIFWLPTNMMELIKIKAKNYKADISNLSISMQEFMNKDIIDNMDYNIDVSNIQHVKNTTDDIYIICSNNSKRNYEVIIKKLESKLKEMGINIKNYYMISETFYNRNSDEISYNKVKLLLQHLIGYKTDVNKFTDVEVSKYDEVCYYDDDLSSINLSKDVNSVLQSILSNTDSVVKSRIKDVIRTEDNILVINQVTPNKHNKFISNRIELKWSNLIKFFERFNWKS